MDPSPALQCAPSHRAQPSPGSKELTLEGNREGANSLQGPAVVQGWPEHLTHTVLVTSSSSAVIMSNNGDYAQ